MRINLFTDFVTKRGICRLGTIATAATAAVLALASGAQAAVTTAADVPQKMPSFNGGVYAMAYDGNTLYVGGSFTQVTTGGTKVTRTDLAAINAQTGALLPWAPTADGAISALAVDPATHTVYVGGAFGHIGGTARDSLAAISSTGALLAFKHSLAGSVNALSVGHGRLYLGGHFSSVDTSSRTNLAAFTLSSGALDTGWAPTADDVVYSVVSDTNKIYIGGKFHKIGGVAAPKLAAVSVDTGVHDATFKPSVAVLVYQVVVGPDGDVYAAEGGQGGRAIEYTPTGANVWTFTTDGDVQAIAYLGGVLYVGGHFDNACKSASTGVHGFCNDGAISRVKLAAVDASTGVLQPWNPTGNGIHGVFAMTSNAALGTVDAAGEFTTLKGVSHGRFAQFH